MNILKKLNKKFKALSPILVYPLYWFYKLLTASLKYTEVGRERLDELHAKGEYLVFCLWHDELFPLMKMQRQFDILTIVSPSADGSFLAGLLNKLGLRTVRGSSTRKGMEALLNGVKIMKTEHVHACVTVDGPTGPRHVVKDGALFLAFRANAYIVPIRIDMKKAYTFNTWDRFKIPFPFSEVVIKYAEPYQVTAEKSDTEHLSQEKEKLQNILNELGHDRNDE